MSEARLAACKEKAYGILAVVFVAGIATGVLGMRAYTGGEPAAQVAESPVKQQTVFAVERLNQDLSLSAEQIAKLTTILDEHIMAEADLLSRMRALQQEGRNEIIEVLTPEQRAKFETMVHPVSGP